MPPVRTSARVHQHLLTALCTRQALRWAFRTAPTPLAVSPPTPSSDSSAVDRARWFLHEVQPHDDQLKAYLRGAFPAMRDVEDVVQESYLRIWKARGLQSIQSTKGLLFQIARRLAIDLLRHGRASPIDAQPDIGALPVTTDAPDAADSAATADAKRLLIEAVAALPTRYREILILRKLQQRPQKEVAERLGLSEKTVENLLARAIKKCEADLRARGALELYRR